jgi:hypothetical protein
MNVAIAAVESKRIGAWRMLMLVLHRLQTQRSEFANFGGHVCWVTVNITVYVVSN